MRRAAIPRSILSAAILLMLYGSLSIACHLCTGATWFMDEDMNARLEKEVPACVPIEVTTTSINLLLGVGMIFAALGVLKLMPIARVASIALCVVSLAIVLTYNLYAVIWLLPAQARIMEAEQLNMPPIFGDVTTATTWGFVIVHVLMTLSLCTLAIQLLNSAQSRAAFAAGYLEPALDIDVDRYADYDGRFSR